MATQGSAPGPFFQYSSGQRLTKVKKFVKFSKPADYTIRILQDTGSATTAAGCGIEDSLIHNLGQWNSDAFFSTFRCLKKNWLDSLGFWLTHNKYYGIIDSSCTQRPMHVTTNLCVDYI